MDNICKICGNLVTEDSHYYKNHKITIANYHYKFFPKYDLFTKEQIPFKSKESYFLNDFINRTNLKKYLDSITTEEGLYYLTSWLDRRKNIKKLDFAPTEFELKSLIFPSLVYWEKKYGLDKYKYICNSIGLQFRCDYNKTPKFSKRNKDKNYICDTREQAILKLPNMQISKLDFGDYTLENSNIFIERKSLTDFINTLSGGFDRFDREIQRCKDKNSYLIVLVEEKYANLQSFEYMPHNHSRCDWSFISHRFRELIQRYPLHLQFLAVDGRKEASRIIQQIFKLKNSIISTDLQFLYNKGEL